MITFKNPDYPGVTLQMDSSNDQVKFTIESPGGHKHERIIQAQSSTDASSNENNDDMKNEIRAFWLGRIKKG